MTLLKSSIRKCGKLVLIGAPPLKNNSVDLNITIKKAISFQIFVIKSNVHVNFQSPLKLNNNNNKKKQKTARSFLLHVELPHVVGMG